jgi:GTP-binding protein
MTQSEMIIRSADFLFGAPSMKAIRKQGLAEVAIVGRSNVGKSSFINRMVARKLARVSGKPGSTRELNFYAIDGRWRGASSQLCLVDMPGFGFARLSKVERESISRLAVDYMRERRQLQAVVLLNDCRREPGEEELAIQFTCASEGIPLVIVLTKFDTLRQGQRAGALLQVASGYNLEPGDVLFTGDGISVDPIWERIHGVLG